jgi:hypothetical protein
MNDLLSDEGAGESGGPSLNTEENDRVKQLRQGKNPLKKFLL